MTEAEISGALAPEEQEQLNSLSKERIELTADRPAYDAIAFVTESTIPVATHVLRRGDYQRPGLEVDPELIEVLSPAGAPPVMLEEPESTWSSGRRLALARALTDPETAAGAHVARGLCGTGSGNS